MHSSEPQVAVVGDYDHFLKGFLRKALDAANITHGGESTSSTEVIIVWNPWSLLQTGTLVPSAFQGKTVNFTHFNCAKSNVSNHFESTFGYTLAVNPQMHVGPMVKKSETNALHDGETIYGPIAGAPEHGFVYQRLIDNSFGPSIIDIRVMIFTGVLEHCFVKVRPISTRYRNENSAAWMADTRSVLTESEISLINGFAESIGLEFGALDVLRDNSSGQIYIVDANNTPFGPPVESNSCDRDRAIALLAADARRVLLAD